VAGTTIVAAGGALSGHIVHAIEGAHHTGHRTARVARKAREPVASAEGWANRANSRAGSISSIGSAAARGPTHRSLPKPPSKSLGYLALGSSASASQTSGPPAEGRSSESSARAASVTSPRAGPERAAAPTGSAGPPAESGGGTSLSYLGK
jgi:hypothetical protein